MVSLISPNQDPHDLLNAVVNDIIARSVKGVDSIDLFSLQFASSSTWLHLRISFSFCFCLRCEMTQRVSAMRCRQQTVHCKRFYKETLLQFLPGHVSSYMYCFRHREDHPNSRPCFSTCLIEILREAEKILSLKKWKTYRCKIVRYWQQMFEENLMAIKERKKGTACRSDHRC